MSKLAMFPDLSLAREQAAEWIARLDRGLDSTEQQEFRQWRASQANAQALQEMAALWDDLGGLKVLADVFPQPAAASTPPKFGRRVSRPALAAAAAVMLSVAASVLFLARDWRTAPDGARALASQTTAFSTAVGEHRSVALADGSVLTLNTDSQVEVALGGQTRDLRLLRGEAHFAVAHDASRPFRVSVDGRVVQAVGTAFDVRLHRGQAVEVIVTEGRVEVLQGETGAITAHLDRGQALWISADGSTQVLALDDATLASRLAWRNGMLVFDGETLQSALDEFARHTPDRFEIADPKLRDLRIGGYFPAGDTDALLEALRSSFGLEVSRAANGVIRIGASDPAS